MPTVKFAKIRKDAIIPSKERFNAGYDIYPCFDEEYMVIPPHTSKMIPTGICSSFDNAFVMVLKERGSTGSKGIAQRAGIIDASYRGEWFVCVTNTNDCSIIITKNENRKPDEQLQNPPIIYLYKKAICQALLLPVPDAEIIECSFNEIQSISSERGSGKLGSSGK